MSKAFCVPIEMIYIFILEFANMAFTIDFVYIKEPLQPGDKFHLIMVYAFFNMLLDYVCYYSVEDFFSFFFF